MATALDVLKRSMRLIGALAAGEEPTADEGSDGLAALNSMLDAWWSKTLAVYYTQDETFTWTGAATTRTMGSGGSFNTTRPARIVSAFQRVSNIDTPIEIITEAEYWRIPDKTTQSSIIGRIFPQYGAALVTLYAYPVPSVSLSVHIQSLARLQSFASLSTDVALPPGYQRTLEYNLAIEIAPEYQAQVPALVAMNAASSLRGIKRTNLEIAPMLVEPGLLSTRRSGYDINTGD